MNENLLYLTNFYNEKIEKIKKINAPLNFVFITDLHNRLNQYGIDGNSGEYEEAVKHIRSISYVLEHCGNIDFVVCGGDVGNDYCRDLLTYKNSVKEVYEALYALNIPAYGVVGNHDDGIGNCFDLEYDCREHSIMPEEMHEICMRYNPTAENYYYIDFDDNYRLVFLNTSDYISSIDKNGKNAFGWRLEISDKQAQWFEQEALNTKRKILLFSHAPLHNSGVFGSEGMPVCIKPYDDTLNAPRILYDIEKSGNVIANICGHVHYDNIVYGSSFVTISTLCSMTQKWCPICPEREFGTATETAFDVYSITDDVIYITRFGAGDDRKAAIIKRQ